MRILIIGGTGTISRWTTEALVAAGHQLSLLHRGPAQRAEPQVIQADRRTPGALAAAIEATRPDVLIDFVCFQPDEAAALARAAAGRVGHLIYVSSVDAIGFPLSQVPASERVSPKPGVGAYAIAKQACEKLLLEEHAKSGLPVTIVRPTYSMSERFVISLFDHSSANLFRALLHRRPVGLTDDGMATIHASNARDTGRMIARMAGEARSIGKTYNAGTKDAIMTQRDYLELIAGVAGATAQIVRLPSTAVDQLALAEFPTGVYANVTRFPLGFAFDMFEADFPDFAWLGDLAAPVRAYLGRLQQTGELDRPPTSDLESVALSRLSPRGQLE